MSVYYLHLPNAVRAPTSMYFSYLKIMSRLQEQTTSNLVTACPKHTAGKHMFSYHSWKASTCRSHFSERTLLDSPRFTFPFFPSPLCNYDRRCHSAEGGRRKRKERVVIWCSYASLPLALSPLFWAPFLVNKQCLPLVSYHIISK